jgi:hypothetical protein
MRDDSEPYIAPFGGGWFSEREPRICMGERRYPQCGLRLWGNVAARIADCEATVKIRI